MRGGCNKQRMATKAPSHGIPKALDAADAAAALSAAGRELAALRMLLAEAVARAGGDDPSGGGGAAAAAVRSGGFVSRAEFVERAGEDLVLRLFSAAATPGLQAAAVGALDASLRRAVAAACGLPPHGAPHAGAAAAACVKTTATAPESEAARRLVTTLLRLGADADGGAAGAGRSGPGGGGAPAYPPPYEWATPLEGAACGGAEVVLGALLEQGADVDGGMSEARPWSPLLAAVWARRAAAARALARAGADTCGVEALAAACGNYDVVRVFEDPEVRFWNAAQRAGKALGIGAFTRASELYAVATRVAESSHLRVSNCV